MKEVPSRGSHRDGPFLSPTGVSVLGVNTAGAPRNCYLRDPFQCLYHVVRSTVFPQGVFIRRSPPWGPLQVALSKVFPRVSPSGGPQGGRLQGVPSRWSSQMGHLKARIKGFPSRGFAPGCPSRAPPFGSLQCFFSRGSGRRIQGSPPGGPHKGVTSRGSRPWVSPTVGSLKGHHPGVSSSFPLGSIPPCPLQWLPSSSNIPVSPPSDTFHGDNPGGPYRGSPLLGPLKGVLSRGFHTCGPLEMVPSKGSNPGFL
jgi:hypothetical protein